MSDSTNKLDELTIAQLLKAVKPVHLVVAFTIFASLLGGAFSFGKSWESHRFDLEVEPLKKANEELSKEISYLKKNNHFYRQKDKFLSLTSTLQFQAHLRGISHQELFRCSSRRQMLSDDHVREIYDEYRELIQVIANNEEEAIAHYGPISRACTPRLISFKQDQSAAYIIDRFIPNKAINGTQ